MSRSNRSAGKTGENLLQILETRLDNVVYRAGLARTRRMARQLVSHGHFTVNGVKVNIPSYRVSQYDIIDVRDKSLNTLPFEVARQTAGDRREELAEVAADVLQREFHGCGGSVQRAPPATGLTR